MKLDLQLDRLDCLDMFRYVSALSLYQVPMKGSVWHHVALPFSTSKSHLSLLAPSINWVDEVLLHSDWKKPETSTLS